MLYKPSFTNDVSVVEFCCTFLPVALLVVAAWRLAVLELEDCCVVVVEEEAGLDGGGSGTTLR